MLNAVLLAVVVVLTVYAAMLGRQSKIFYFPAGLGAGSLLVISVLLLRGFTLS